MSKVITTPNMVKNHSRPILMIRALNNECISYGFKNFRHNEVKKSEVKVITSFSIVTNRTAMVSLV